MRWIKSLSQIGIALGIIALSVVIALIIYLSKSDVQKVEARPRALLVDVMKAKPTTEQVKFVAYGTVTPDKSLVVNPEVSGKVVELAPNLTTGGLLESGDLLLKIDPTDFELAVEQAEAEVTRAEFELRLEEGRQVVAKREWELLNPTIKASEIGEDLALRKPHLKERKAALAAAESRLKQAEVNLKRTKLTSPFNAIVINETIEKGQYITPQTDVATLVDSDTFRVRVSLPFDRLRWISLPSNGHAGSKIVITQTIGDDMVVKRPGWIMRLLGDVDPEGRLARIDVAIDDPLSLGSETEKRPLLLGTYVGVEFFGPKIPNVYKIPRIAVHNSNVLWIKNEQDELEFRTVHILFTEDDFVFIDQGLKPGEDVVLTPLSLPLPGTKLRVDGADEE